MSTRPPTNGSTTPSSQRTTNRKAQEEKEQEITCLSTREQCLKRNIRALQSVNEETKVALEELREVVDIGITKRSKNDQTCSIELYVWSSRRSKMHTNGLRRSTTHEAELAKSLVCLNGTASLGGRSALGKPSLGVALEVETVAQVLDWAVSRNKTVEAEIGILANKITCVKSTAKGSSRDISAMPKPSSKAERGDRWSFKICTRLYFSHKTLVGPSTLTPTPPPTEPSRLHQSTNDPPKTDEEFPPRRPRRPQTQQQRPITEPVPSIGTAGYNPLSEQIHAFKAQIDGSEGDRGEWGGVVGRPMEKDANGKSDPDNKHIESTSDVAIDAFERAQRGLVRPISSLSTISPRQHGRTSSLGSRPSTPTNRPYAPSSDAPPASTQPKPSRSGTLATPLSCTGSPTMVLRRSRTRSTGGGPGRPSTVIGELRESAGSRKAGIFAVSRKQVGSEVQREEDIRRSEVRRDMQRKGQDGETHLKPLQKTECFGQQVSRFEGAREEDLAPRQEARRKDEQKRDHDDDDGDHANANDNNAHPSHISVTVLPGHERIPRHTTTTTVAGAPPTTHEIISRLCTFSARRLRYCVLALSRFWGFVVRRQRSLPMSPERTHPPSRRLASPTQALLQEGGHLRTIDGLSPSLASGVGLESSLLGPGGLPAGFIPWEGLHLPQVELSPWSTLLYCGGSDVWEAKERGRLP
ncbi:hypothetical protein BKA70DRAFT_1398909 [Coprinopsis sp. MPI-PUGE-AT-0042]|nr:hypothetical protein BKA70DRAFT_1398909 [Coprinopsis sp. MPI-PUGE-AT-0042]